MEQTLRHPSEAELVSFNKGALKATALAAVGLHLEECSACCTRLGELASSDRVLDWLRRTANETMSPAGQDSIAFRGNGATDSRQGPSADSSEPPSPSIPGYQIEGVLGRGGMGVVYKARHLKTNRIVALKLILAAKYADLHDKVRFQIEAEAVAHLQHPNIVQLHDVGDQGGMPYFSLEFCPGGSLDEKLKTWTPTANEAASLIATLAQAMQHAHLRGVIHRDLKPANVLLAGDGTPKITDFGLAKNLNSSIDISRSGAIMGTAAYMAPEQAEGKVRDTGPSADVYSLGALLYELLSGRPPFEGATTFETIQQVLTAEPTPPSRVRTGVPRDLETIVIKAMDKKPQRRYATAQELAEDLRRFLDDEPIRARPIGAVQRAARWARRRPVLASLIAVVLALTTTVIVGAIGAAITFHDLAGNEARQREKAENATKLAHLQAKAAEDAHKASQEISDLMLGVLDETDPLALSGRVFGGHGGARTEELKPVHVLQRTLAKLQASPQIGPKDRAKLLDKIGAVYVSVGEFDKGTVLLKEALTLRQAEHGEDSLEAAATLHHLGLAYLAQRLFEQADETYRQALAIRERRLAPDDPLVALTVMQLGIVKVFASDGPQAMALLRRAKAALHKHPGPESREYGVAVTLLAIVLIGEGEVDEAQPLLPEALSLIQKHEGETGTARAMGLFLQGRFAAKLGLTTQAIKQHREAIEITKQGLGDEHFLVLMTRTELASYYLELSETQAAETEYLAVQRSCEKMFGVQSGQVALIKMFRARVMRQEMQYAEAEVLLREASDVMRKRQNQNLGRCLHIYAEILQKQDKYPESVPVLVEAVRERKKKSDLYWYSNAAYDLAMSFEHLGKREEAVRELADANRHLARQATLSTQLSWVLGCRSAQEYRLLKLLGKRDAEADAAATIAINALRSSLQARGKTARDLANEPALNPLRNLPAFQPLLNEEPE